MIAAEPTADSGTAVTAASFACFLLPIACVLLPLLVYLLCGFLAVLLGVGGSLLAVMTPEPDWEAEVEAARGEEAVVMSVEGLSQRTVFLETRVLLLDDELRLLRPRVRRESVPYAAVRSHALEKAAWPDPGSVLTIRAGEGVERRRHVLDDDDAQAADRLLAEAVGRAVRGGGVKDARGRPPPAGEAMGAAVREDPANASLRDRFARAATWAAGVGWLRAARALPPRRPAGRARRGAGR